MKSSIFHLKRSWIVKVNVIFFCLVKTAQRHNAHPVYQCSTLPERRSSSQRQSSFNFGRSNLESRTNTRRAFLESLPLQSHPLHATKGWRVLYCIRKLISLPTRLWKRTFSNFHFFITHIYQVVRKLVFTVVSKEWSVCL